MSVCELLDVKEGY